MNRNAVFYYVAGVVTALTLFTFKRLLSPNGGLDSVQGRRKKAIFFGDSITSHGFSVAINGWLCNFAEWWVRRVDVINRGFSGYNSRWGLMIVDEIVVREKPDIVFVFFGANDAVDAQVGQHVSLPEYVQNMQGIVDKVKKVNSETTCAVRRRFTKHNAMPDCDIQGLPVAKLILITPPPIWEDKVQEMNLSKGRALLLDRTNERYGGSMGSYLLRTYSFFCNYMMHAAGRTST